MDARGSALVSDRVSRTLGPGWRCNACDYPLEGLPDRSEHTQCPECGHTARPVGARSVPSTAAVVFAVFLSVGSLVASAYAAWIGWLMVNISGPEGWIAIALAAGWVAVAAAVWGTVDGRWTIVRWLAAIVPATCAAFGAWAAQSIYDLIPVAYLCFGTIAAAWLINPELDRWLRRPRSSARP